MRGHRDSRSLSLIDASLSLSVQMSQTRHRAMAAPEITLAPGNVQELSRILQGRKRHIIIRFWWSFDFFLSNNKISLRVTTLYYESKKYSPTYERRKRTFINTGTVRKDDARTVSSTAKQAHGGGAHRAERFGAPEKLRVESGAFLFWVFSVFFVFLVVLTSFFLCIRRVGKKREREGSFCLF